MNTKQNTPTSSTTTSAQSLATATSNASKNQKNQKPATSLTLELSNRVIERSRCPKSLKQQLLRDTQVSGLGVKLYPSGQKTFIVRVRSEGRTQDIKLGDACVLSVKEARLLATQHLKAFALGEATLEPKVESPTLDEFYQKHYLPFIKQHLRRWDTADSYFRNHLKPSLGSTLMHAITYESVLELQSLRIQTHKPATCNRMLVLLRTMFNRAISWGIQGVTDNPTQDIQLFKLNNKKERYLTDEEMDRLMAAIEASQSRAHLLPIIQMLALTGARKREVLDMRWQDIDLKNHLWTITQNKSGKTQTKPLSDAAIILLTQLAEKATNNPDTQQNDWVFANPKTGKPFNTIFKSWNTARIKAGLAEVRIHDLRHNFASQLVNQGRSLYEVQKLLGHADATTTQRYAHLSQDRLREAASCVRLPDPDVLLSELNSASQPLQQASALEDQQATEQLQQKLFEALQADASWSAEEMLQLKSLLEANALPAALEPDLTTPISTANTPTNTHASTHAPTPDQQGEVTQPVSDQAA